MKPKVRVSQRSTLFFNWKFRTAWREIYRILHWIDEVGSGNRILDYERTRNTFVVGIVRITPNAPRVSPYFSLTHSQLQIVMRFALHHFKLVSTEHETLPVPCCEMQNLSSWSFPVSMLFSWLFNFVAITNLKLDALLLLQNTPRDCLLLSKIGRLHHCNIELVEPSNG